MITKKKKCQRGGASVPKQAKTTKTQKTLSTSERRANRVESIDSTSKKHLATCHKNISNFGLIQLGKIQKLL